MKPAHVWCALLVCGALSGAVPTHEVSLFFEPNRGQAPVDTLWIARTADSSVLIGDTGLSILNRNKRTLRLEWIGSTKPAWQSGERLRGVTNYYLPHVRAAAVPQFASVAAKSVWPGIDIRLHGSERQLEYDFHVAPRADVSVIRFRFDGGTPALHDDGSLAMDDIQIRPPIAWQDGLQIPVRYQVNSRGEVGFDIGEYDRSRSLLIDPVVVSLGYSTLIGGHGDDVVSGIRVNAQGESFVTGSTNSTDFATGTALRTSKDLFVAKLAASGTALLYLTFFGGSGDDEGASIGIDAGGNALVGGTTSSTNIAHVSPFQAANGGRTDALIAKFGPTGQLVWSSYFGGALDDSVSSAVVDPADSSIVLAGLTASANFPTSAGAWQTTPLTGLDGSTVASFVARFSASGSRSFATYVSSVKGPSGIGGVNLARVALDSASNIVISGMGPGSMPITPGYQQISDIVVPFLGKLAANGASMMFLRHFAIFSFQHRGLAVDSSGRMYIAGMYAGIVPDTTKPGSEIVTCCGTYPTVMVFTADGKTIEKQLLPFEPRLANLYWWMFNVSSIALHTASDSVWIGGYGALAALPATNPLIGSFPAAVYKTTNSGSAWTAEPLNVTGVREIASNGTYRYALTPSALYRQATAGGAWVQVFDKQPLSMAVAPGSSTIYAGTLSGIFRSTDAGTTWSAITKPAPEEVTSIGAIQGAPNRLLASTYSTGKITRDGGNSWANVMNGGGLQRMISHASAPVLYAASQHILYRFANDTWDDIHSNFHSWAVDSANNDTLYVRSFETLYRSMDGGLTWTVRKTGVPAFEALAASGTTLMGAAGQTMYKSTDGGVTWIENSVKAPAAVTLLYAENGAFYAITNTLNEDAWVANVSLTSGELRSLIPFGGAGRDAVRDIAIDSAGAVYVAGIAGDRTDAPDTRLFPTSAGGVRATAAGMDGFVVKLATTSCTVTATPALATVAAPGGTGNIAVAATDCPWSATSGSPWITLSGPASGVGNASISWTASPNPTSAARTGSVVIGGNIVAIEQAGSACSLGIGTSSENVGATAGSGAIQVSAALNYCTWQAITTAQWVTLGVPSGTGAGNLSFTFAANATVFPRTAQIAVAGQTFTLHQAGASCAATLRSSGFSAPASGALHAVPLNPVPVGCDVTVSSNVPWIRAAATGGYAGLEVGTNTGAARTGLVTVSGLTYTVNQAAGSGCMFSLDSASLNVDSSGRLGGATVSLTASGQSCPWTAFSDARWIQVYPLSGTGNRAVTITVLPNFSTGARTATVNIAGQTYTVTQTANIEGSNQRFVRLIYFSAFGRSPSPPEVQFHVDSLATLSRADVVNNFLASEEFRRSGRFVAGAYVGLLNRDADYGGWQFQRNAMALGITYPWLLTDSFLKSAEYASLFGQPSNPEFVRLLYRYILLREPTAAEVDYQVFNLPWQGRNRLADSFLNSEEFRIKTNSRMLAFLLSAALQMRDPTGEERHSRVTAIDAGTPLKTLIEQALASPGHAALLN